jgi:S1-C subfamily serine protease
MKSRMTILSSLLFAGLLLTSLTSPLSAAPFTQIKEGQKCGKLNRIVSDNISYFQCLKKGKIMVWQVKGIVPSATTTLAPKTRTTQVANLQEFVNTYGKSVVTIYCGSGSGSGVSVPSGTSSWKQELGAQSVIATNLHVVEDCVNSGTYWRDNLVTILHQGVEYAGYVNGWPSFAEYRSGVKPDLATVMTTGLIPTTSYWNVRAPQLGDAVVAIGSAGGVPNITTRGEVAGVTAKDIITTAPAGHGSSGGALFNNDGQLLGFIYSANASLVNVVPIPRLCEAVFNCTTPITYIP